MQQASRSFLALISEVLRADYNAVAEEPLPARWVDLINHLNERERAEGRKSDRKESEERAKRH